MFHFNRVVIVGVGLLGGSIGRALRERGLATDIVGVGRSGRVPREAIAIGAIDRVSEDLATAAQGADLAIICTPVGTVASAVQTCAEVIAPDGMITDVGSTKATIVDAVEAAGHANRFCGSHPLAGGHQSGADHSSPTLLDGKLVVVTPSEQTPETLTLRTEQLWRALGARTLRMAPQAHDEALARTSHLPHVVASVLAGVTPRELLPLVATGWRDTTRVAEGNAHLWRQILEENAESVLRALENFDFALDDWIIALRDRDGDRLEQLLASGKAIRDALGN